MMLLGPLISKFALLATAIVGAIATPAIKPALPGFVTTKGTQFELNGRSFVSKFHIRCIAILMSYSRLSLVRTLMYVLVRVRQSSNPANTNNLALVAASASHTR